MSVRQTWAAMFEPERYPPPPLTGLSVAWRYGLSVLWFFFFTGTWLMLLREGAPTTVLGLPFEFPIKVGTVPPVWFLILNSGLTLLCLALIQQRRRHPLAIAAFTQMVAIVAGSVAVMVVWAYLSLASRRKMRDNIIMLIVSLATSLVVFVLPWAASFHWFMLVQLAAAAAILMLVGMYIGVRRDRAAGFLRRVEQAEQDRAFAVLAERNRIAREMHDVLAHRISLVSMHAGVLAYRDDLPPEKTREIAQVIQENAHASLTELRSVLSTLRKAPSDPPGAGDGGAVEAPQPTLAALSDLIEAARDSGQQLRVQRTLDEAAVPQVQQRHLYRILQECLTNARKHAPHAAVEVALSGTQSTGITVRVANEVTEVVGSIPGAKLGLVGITERATMLGGRVDAGVQGGRFVVEAWLPWSPDFRRNQ